MQFMPHSKMKNDAVGTVSDGWLGSVPQMWITLTAAGLESINERGFLEADVQSEPCSQ